MSANPMIMMLLLAVSRGGECGSVSSSMVNASCPSSNWIYLSTFVGPMQGSVGQDRVTFTIASTNKDAARVFEPFFGFNCLPDDKHHQDFPMQDLNPADTTCASIPDSFRAVFPLRSEAVYANPGRWIIGLKRCGSKPDEDCGFDVTGSVLLGTCLPPLTMMTLDDVKFATKCGGDAQKDTGAGVPNPTPAPATSALATSAGPTIDFGFAPTPFRTLPLGGLPKDAPPIGVTVAGCALGDVYCGCVDDACSPPLTCADRLGNKRCECLLGSNGCACEPKDDVLCHEENNVCIDDVCVAQKSPQDSAQEDGADLFFGFPIITVAGVGGAVLCLLLMLIVVVILCIQRKRRRKAVQDWYGGRKFSTAGTVPFHPADQNIGLHGIAQQAPQGHHHNHQDHHLPSHPAPKEHVQHQDHHLPSHPAPKEHVQHHAVINHPSHFMPVHAPLSAPLPPLPLPPTNRALPLAPVSIIPAVPPPPPAQHVGVVGIVNIPPPLARPMPQLPPPQ